MRVHATWVLLLGTSLAACSHETPPPQIHYDAADFKPAAVRQDPPPPAPPPPPPPGTVFGPVLPVADIKAVGNLPPAQSVQEANRKALYEPTRANYINAAQVYPYYENALYRLYTATGEVSDVALQPGEALSAISAGDTVRWVVGNTTSGNGKDRQVHVLVKPVQAGLNTDLVILTDRHAYHLKLQSTDHTGMAAISWSYPSESLIIKASADNIPTQAASEPIDRGIAVEDIKFRYTITGDNPPWRPVRAFDDGHKVYIEFPARIDQGDAPPLFTVGPDGGTQLVNFRMRGNYYVVDQLFGAAELRMGQDKQQVVRISRTDGTPAAKAGG